MISYSSAVLKGIRSCVPSNLRLSNYVWKSLTINGISRYKPTRRGCRAGTRKIRSCFFHQDSIPLEVQESLPQRSYLPSKEQPTLNIQVLVSSRSSKNNPSNYNCSNHEPVERTTNRLSPGEMSPLRHINNLIQIKPVSQKTGVLLPSRFGLLNTRSMVKKTTQICDLVISNRIDVLALTETWLKGTEKHCIADIYNTLPHYSFFHVPRSRRKGGGVGFLVRDGYSVVENQLDDLTSFEYQDITLSYRGESLRLINIYRPPTITASIDCFLDEFSLILERITLIRCPLIISGDFNLHVDDPANNHAQKFLNLIDSTDLVQNVTGSTHTRGHTLDLVLTRELDNIVSDVCVLPSDGISDHKLIICGIRYSKPPLPKVTVLHRDTQNILIDDFCEEVKTCLQSMDMSDDIADLTKQYNEKLSNLFEHHAPVSKRVITLRPNAPWYDGTLRKAKQEKRKCERKLKKSGLEIHRQIFQGACAKYNEMLLSSKTAYFSRKLIESDQRQLFHMVTKMFQTRKTPPLPEHTSKQQLADDFNLFFTDKIQAIRDELDAKSCATPLATARDITQCKTSFLNFVPTSLDDVQDLILKSPTKSCSLDPVPTCLLKKIPQLFPFITRIINTSLQSGHFPDVLKSSLVRPTLKKPDLDQNNLSNYRPISNLPFLAKTIERVVSNQLYTYLDINDLFPKMQSAYRRYHSTETALIRVSNDILRDIDHQKSVVLVMLDLSSAFDTIDHDTLLLRLENRFGVSGGALEWFKSYLSCRKQSVKVDQHRSEERYIRYGVPQGSVLGPLLFALYMSPIEDIVHSCGLSCMMYADDSQLYVTLDVSQPLTSVEILMSCVNNVLDWIHANKLKCNPDKTEAIQFVSRYKAAQQITTLSVGGENIDVSGKVRNLGVALDSTLHYRSHVNNICKSASYAIRNIGRLRKYLSRKQLESVVHAFVTSRLDYCNGLLYGLPSCDIQKLQRIQNTAARLIVGARSRDRITPILNELHWLRVEERIEFKILLLTYKALHGMAPQYIKDILNHYKPTRNLRSNNRNLLVVPDKLRTKTYGDRAFSSAAPKLWNQLNENIKSAKSVNEFKSLLKTYLFSNYF